ncbi:MAG TPA: AMP-binding protein [bacterium]|nr:AMP-binding protein [bacterium]HPR88410.1 AMP-binding protein [bacterium]
MVTLQRRTLLELFRSSVARFSGDVALAFVNEEPFLFTQVGHHVDKIMAALRQRGIGPGDRIALLGENSPRWCMTYLAVTGMGAVIVPILNDFHKSDIHHIIRSAGAKGLFISSKLVHKVAELNMRSFDLVVSLDDQVLEFQNGACERFSDLVAGKEPLRKKKASRHFVEPQEEDLAEILYTSGTMGHSKGVMLTHRNIVANALSALEAIQIDHTDCLLSILPLSHAYQCTCGFIAPFALGAKVYFFKGLPTAATLLPAIQAVQPTIILSVPLIMDKIYKKKVLGEINSRKLSKTLYRLTPMKKVVHHIAGKRLTQAFGSRMRLMVFGGAATPPDLEAFLMDGGFPYTTGYGLTECAPLLTVNPVGRVKLQSAGKTVPGVTLRILDPDPRTGIGEIIARGPNIMKGYYHNEEATRAAFTDEGWLITGDRGVIDAEGYLYIKGRSRNIIVGPSGENIYPEEIEYHLSESPFVLESLVYEQAGHIVARIHLDMDAMEEAYHLSRLDGSEAVRLVAQKLEAIRAEVNAELASYARIHRVIEQPEEFEKTPTKKIKRYLYTN